MIHLNHDNQAAHGWGLIESIVHEDGDAWLHCPVCGSEDLEGYSFQVEAGVVWQNVQCQTCHSDWLEVYKPEARETINVSPEGIERANQ